MDIMALINSVGLPIALLIVLGIYLRDMIKTNYQDYKSREGELLKANKEFAAVLDATSKRLSATLEQHAELAERMDTAEEKLDMIEDKLDTIHEKVEKVRDNVDKLL